MWRTAVRYFVQREKFTIKSTLPAEEYLRRLDLAIAKPFEVFAPKAEQPLRGELHGNEFEGRIRFPYMVEDATTVTARVDSTENGCAVHVVVAGSSWAVVLYFALAILMAVIAARQMATKEWTWGNLIPIGVLIFMIVGPFNSRHTIFTVRHAAEDVFGAICVREPKV